MTLDGHLKSGFSCGCVWLVYATSLFGPMDETTMTMTAAMIIIGNVAPDFLEMKVIPHRTYTHFPWYYVSVIFVVSWLSGMLGVDIPFFEIKIENSVAFPILGFCFGALFHLLCDWPYYGGIPLITPRRKIPLTQIEFGGVANRVLEHSVVILALVLIVSSSVDFHQTKDIDELINWSTTTLD